MENGKCHHHASQEAVTKCGKCEKSICKDCAEMYGVVSGKYADKTLCYDCTTQLVAENVEEISKFRKKTKIELIIIAIGAIAGIALGLSIEAYSVGQKIFNATFLGLLGGSGLVAIKALGKCLGGGSDLARGNVSGVVKASVGLFTLFTCPFQTIWNVKNKVSRTSQTKKIIESDSSALQEMQDYFAYTQFIEKSVAEAIDLAKLVEQGGALFENSYAKIVLDKGEKEAQKKLRQSVVAISENGEIVRNYDPKYKAVNAVKSAIKKTAKKHLDEKTATKVGKATDFTADIAQTNQTDLLKKGLNFAKEKM